jgi:hypothetical protein
MVGARRSAPQKERMNKDPAEIDPEETVSETSVDRNGQWMLFQLTTLANGDSTERRTLSADAC